jgi:hypothetical protein
MHSTSLNASFSKRTGREYSKVVPFEVRSNGNEPVTFSITTNLQSQVRQNRDALEWFFIHLLLS